MRVCLMYTQVDRPVTTGQKSNIKIVTLFSFTSLSEALNRFVSIRSFTHTVKGFVLSDHSDPCASPVFICCCSHKTTFVLHEV